MIVVKLIGGLGNQLFQYAAGRHLAELHKTDLKLDILGFETYKLHRYSLWAFNIIEKFATEEEVSALTAVKKSSHPQWFPKFLREKRNLASTHIREKKLFHFDPEISELPDNIYLDGYWQNEKYFSNISDVIRREATVKGPPEGRDKELAEMISATESVSIHIRRGDYVSNPKTKEAHGLCGLGYYLSCVEELTGIVQSPHFYIFSDDPEWARDNLELSYPATLVDHNSAEKNYEDLRLMSLCRHHIIANSSFSWWGAWLNPREDKVVFAPRRWYAKSRDDLPDVTPSQWIRK